MIHYNNNFILRLANVIICLKCMTRTKATFYTCANVNRSPLLGALFASTLAVCLTSRSLSYFPSISKNILFNLTIYLTRSIRFCYTRRINGYKDSYFELEIKNGIISHFIFNRNFVFFSKLIVLHLRPTVFSA